MDPRPESKSTSARSHSGATNVLRNSADIKRAKAHFHERRSSSGASGGDSAKRLRQQHSGSRLHSGAPMDNGQLSVQVRRHGSHSRHNSTAAAASSYYSDTDISYPQSEAMQIKFAGRTFTLGSPRASKHGRSKKWPPRKRFMCGFLVSMVLVLAAFAFQLLSFKNVGFDLIGVATLEESVSLDYSYSMKLGHMSLQLEEIQMPGIIQDYLVGGYGPDSAEAQATQALLRNAASQLQFEYLTLVSPQNSTIILNSSFMRNRTGQVFNPAGLVSAVVADPEYTLTAHALETYDTLMEEEPPEYREPLSVTTPSALEHPYDTKGPSLVRYLAKPVFDERAGMEGNLLAVLVAGDVVNGKPTICGRVTGVYGGFAGIYHVHPSDVNSPPGSKRWIKACSSMVVHPVVVNKESVTTAAFDPLVDGDLEITYNKQGEVVTMVEFANNVMYAITPMPNAIRHVNSLNGTVTFSDPTDVGPTTTTMIRGINMEDATIFTDLLKGCVGFLIALVVLQSILNWISIESFIHPLEKAAAHLKINRKVDIKLLTSAALFARYWFCVTTGMVSALLFLIYILVNINNALSTAVNTKVIVDRGVPYLFWGGATGTLSTSSQVIAEMPSVKNLLDVPLSTTYLNETSTILTSHAMDLRVEHVLLVNASNHVIFSANPGSQLIGTVVDPNEIASLARHDKKQYRANTVTLNAMLLMDNAPRYKDQNIPSTPESDIEPLDPASTDMIVTTWVAQPVFTPSNTDGLEADGVLLLGQIHNAKTRIMEQTVLALSGGYASVYAYNYIHNRFDLVTSAFLDLVDRSMHVDLAANGIEGILIGCLYGAPMALTDSVMIGGLEHMAVAVPIPWEEKYTPSSGSTYVLTAQPAPAFFVLAQPRGMVTRAQNKARLIVALCLIFQLLILAGMNYLAYQPYAALMKALQVRGFVKPGDRPTFFTVVMYFIYFPARCYRYLKSCACCASSKVSAAETSGDEDYGHEASVRPTSGADCAETAALA